MYIIFDFYNSINKFYFVREFVVTKGICDAWWVQAFRVYDYWKVRKGDYLFLFWSGRGDIYHHYHCHLHHHHLLLLFPSSFFFLLSPIPPSPSCFLCLIPIFPSLFLYLGCSLGWKSPWCKNYSVNSLVLRKKVWTIPHIPFLY